MSYVKTFAYFFKFVFSKPSVVKKVVDQEYEDLGGRVHDLLYFEHAHLQGLKVLNECLRLYHRYSLRILHKPLNVKEKQEQRLLDLVDNLDFGGEALNLVYDGVDGVAHLMGYRSVDQSEQVVLRESFVVKNLLRNVDYLN